VAIAAKVRPKLRAQANTPGILIVRFTAALPSLSVSANS
jgi:hypothetical protein